MAIQIALSLATVVFFIVAVAVIVAGAYEIHFGLGLMVSGALMILSGSLAAAALLAWITG